MIRTVLHDRNNFQWKINVAIRTIHHLLSSARLSAFYSSFRLLCFCYLLFCSASAIFFSLFISSNVPSALPALLFLLWYSFIPSFICSALPALLDWGAYPFLEKPKYHFLPPKIPAIFSKTSPYQTNNHADLTQH